MTSVNNYTVLHGSLFDKVLCNRKNLTTMEYQWLGLYSSVNLTGEESNKLSNFASSHSRVLFPIPFQFF